MTLYDAAKHVLSTLCDERYEGYGVVFTETPTMQRIPRRRRHARERERLHLSHVAREVADDLRGGADTRSVGEIIATAGLKDSIRVTSGYAELLEAIIDRFRAGDNVWDEGASGRGAIVLHFWHDPTHRRVCDGFPSTQS